MRLYIVKAGDTLSSIAEKYGLELEQLLAINPQITDPDNIMPGMKIKIASGPVAIGPGQPEIGHSIHQMPQEQMPQVQTPQVETPFMQIPIPPVEAGQSGTPLYPTNGQSGVGMSGQVGSESTPYLSTIPQHFAGNPLYSGVGVADGSSQSNVSTQQASGTLNQSSSGFTGMSMQQPSNLMPSTSPNQMNQSYQPQSLPTYPSNQTLNVQPSLTPASGTPGVWPDSAYSWSTPFEQMAMTSNMSMYGPSKNAPFMHTASNVPLTMQSANQMPIGLQAANAMPGVNMPLANTMPMAMQTANAMPMANAMPVMKKKPCGCGGSSIGHYSLAQKRLAEAQVQADGNGETTANTGQEVSVEAQNEDRSVATVEAGSEQQHNQAVQSDDKPIAEIKQSTRRKVTKNRSNKRKTQKRQRTKAKIHKSEGARSTFKRSSDSYADEFIFGEQEETQVAFNSRQPQVPWLNV